MTYYFKNDQLNKDLDTLIFTQKDNIFEFNYETLQVNQIIRFNEILDN